MNLPEPSRSRTTGGAWLLLGLFSVFVATAAKLLLIGAGPDLEPDSYGHAQAARFLIQDPADLRVHWVWLPFGHLVFALLLFLRFGMDGMRYLNCALTSLLALSMAYAVGPRVDRAFRWTTVALVALSPLALSTGESGVFEPLFAWLLVVGASSLRRGRGVTAGAIGACAVLLRYEGWVLAPVWLWQWWRSGKRWDKAWSWLLPVATLGAYLAVRASRVGMLDFVRANQAFAQGFYEEVAVHWPVPPHASWMSLWYGLFVPAIVLGPLFPFALVGAGSVVRAGPEPLGGSLLGVLVFLSAGFAMRQHLGLLRHALTLLPLYAIAATAGLLRTGRWAHRHFGVRRIAIGPFLLTFATLAVILLATTRTLPTYLGRMKLHEHGHAEDLAIATALRSVWTERSLAFCNVTAVETLADLRPGSFVRWKPLDIRIADLESHEASGRDVLLVGTEDETQHLRRNLRRLTNAGKLALYRYEPAPLDRAAGQTGQSDRGADGR